MENWLHTPTSGDTKTCCFMDHVGSVYLPLTSAMNNDCKESRKKTKMMTYITLYYGFVHHQQRIDDN
jgi:hypothetical protein